MLLLIGQRPEEEAVVSVVILALLAALVRAPAAGRAVAGGVARFAVPPAGGGGVPGRGQAPPESRAEHGHAPVSGRGGRLRLDVEVLVTQVQVRVLTQVPHVSERRVLQVLYLLLLPVRNRAETRTSEPGQRREVAAEGEL